MKEKDIVNNKEELQRSKINRKIVINGLLFVVFLCAMMYLVLKDNDLSAIWHNLTQVNIWYVFLACMATFLYLCCEGRNYSKILRSLNNDVSFIKGLKYSCIGFFFSAITPSATGGGPFQVYYMTKDKVSLSHASLSVFLELAGFHMATLVVTTIGLIIGYQYVADLPTGFHLLLIAGYIVKIFLILMFMFGIFSRRLSRKIVNTFIGILNFLKIKKTPIIKEKLLDELEKYGDGAKYVKHNKVKFVESMLLVLLQVVISYVVPYLIYRSFGLNETSIVTFIALQAVLYTATSIVPIPGAVGVTESGFLNIYNILFPAFFLTPAMLLTRFANFYLFVIICGIVTIVNQFIIGKEK